jgi:hypothetical protein
VPGCSRILLDRLEAPCTVPIASRNSGDQSVGPRLDHAESQREMQPGPPGARTVQGPSMSCTNRTFYRKKPPLQPRCPSRPVLLVKIGSCATNFSAVAHGIASPSHQRPCVWRSRFYPSITEHPATRLLANNGCASPLDQTDHRVKRSARELRGTGKTCG